MNGTVEIQGYTVEDDMEDEVLHYLRYGMTVPQAIAVSHFYYSDDDLSKIMRVAPEEISDIREEGFDKIHEWETANPEKVYHFDRSKVMYTPGAEEMYRKMQARDAEDAAKRQKSWLYRHSGITWGLKLKGL